MVIIIIPISQRGEKKLSDWPTVNPPARGEPEIPKQAFWLQGQYSLPPLHTTCTTSIMWPYGKISSCWVKWVVCQVPAMLKPLLQVLCFPLMPGRVLRDLSHVILPFYILNQEMGDQVEPFFLIELMARLPEPIVGPLLVSPCKTFWPSFNSKPFITLFCIYIFIH